MRCSHELAVNKSTASTRSSPAIVPSQLAQHLEGLARALEGDLSTHRKLIIDTLLDCARSLHTKSGGYGTLSGLLNASDGGTISAISI